MHTTGRSGLLCFMYKTIESISELNYFVAACETLSFRKAAKRLKTSPSTVSRRITDLENLLGVQLFVRTTRNVFITEVGAKLLANVKPALATLADATEQASHDRDRMSGVVRIATSHTMAQANILPVIPQLRAQYPDLRLEILLDEEMIDMRENGIDIALRAGTLNDPTLIALKICVQTIYSYVRPDMLKDDARPILSYGGIGEEQESYVDVKNMHLLHNLVMACRMP